MDSGDYQQGSYSGGWELNEAGRLESEVERSVARASQLDLSDPYADAPKDRRHSFVRKLDDYLNRW